MLNVHGYACAQDRGIDKRRMLSCFSFTVTSFPKKSTFNPPLNKTVTLVTVIEVRCDARLHDPRHVPHRRETAGAGGEERQNREAPPLPVEPRNDTSGERLARRDADPVQQSQSVAEQPAEGHVPLLQTRLWRQEEGQPT